MSRRSVALGPSSGDRAPVLPRAAVPGGRAALGTLLVAAAALSGFVAVRRSEHTVGHPVVVAARALAPGQALQPDDVRVERLALPASLLAQTVDDPARLDGVTLLGPVGQGELIQVGALLRKAGGAGTIEFSLPVDATLAVGGRVRDADRVTVLATTGTGERAETAELVRDALVAHVDRPDRSISDGRGTLVVTLALDHDADAVLLAHAVATGKVALVRTTGAPGHAAGGPGPGASSSGTPIGSGEPSGAVATTPTLAATTVATDVTTAGARR